MNTVILTLAMVLSTITRNETIVARNEVKQQIERSLTASSLNLPLEMDQKGLVRASIRVDELGKLHLVDANYSHKELKDLLEQTLNQIEVNGNLADEILYYEFLFEKH